MTMVYEPKYMEVFVTNPDDYARQQANGSYRRVKQSITLETISNHLKHKKVNGHPFTMGIYSQLGDRCKWVCLDADEDINLLWKIGSVLEGIGIPYYIERSRRGGHLWVLFEGYVHCILARKLAIGAAYQCGAKVKGINLETGYDIEVFPHRDNSDGIGYLVRAPYGLHIKDGKVHKFIDNQGSDIEIHDFLDTVMLVSELQLEQAVDTLPKEEKPELPQKVLRKVNLRDSESLISIINSRLDLRTLIRNQGISVSHSGAFCCPFHDDNKESAGIFSNGDLWKCHACGTYGDASEFYYRLKAQDSSDIKKGEALRELAHEMGIGWRAKKRYREIVVPQPDPSSTVALHDVQQVITKTLEDFCRAENRNRVKLIVTPAGTGRSTLATDFINLKTTEVGLSSSWLAIRHNLNIPGQEGWNHYYGRNERNCLQYDLCQTLGSKHWKPADVCKACYYASMCDYWEQFKNKGGIFPAEHLILSYPFDCDFMVIDENPLQQLLEEIEITADDLLEAAQGHESVSALFPAFAETIKREDIQGKFGNVLYSVLDSALKVTRNSCLNTELEQAQRCFDGQVMDTTGATSWQVRSYPKYFVAQLLETMGKEVKLWQRGEDFNSKLGVHEKKLFMTSLKRLGKSKNLPPIVLLDATGNAELYSKVLGLQVDRLEINNVEKSAPVEIIQVRDNYYGREALFRGKGVYLSTVRKINYLLREKNLRGKISLITHKYLARRMAGDLNITEFGWFGGERGSNRFEDVDILLVVGTPSISPFDIQRIGQAIWYDDSPLDLSSQRGKYYIFNDRRLQLLQEQYREEELYQTANRARIYTTAKPKTLIIFSNVLSKRLLPTLIVDSFPTLSKNYLKTSEIPQHETELLLKV